MQKVKIYLAVFVGLMTAVVACKKKDAVNPSTPVTPDPVEEVKVKTAGKFGLTQMHANQRVRKQVIDGVTYVPYETAKNQRTTEVANFDLGNLKASKSFYFILSNNGDRAITDVTIESNNPQFEIFPKSIDKLAGASEDGIVPLLELGVIHGNRLNGIGFQSLLPMGDNTVEVTIKGKTQGENGEEAVELKAQVKLFAQVMDVEFYVDGQKIDYVSKLTVVGYNAGGLGSLFRYITPTDGKFEIKNVGNVKLNLEYKGTNSNTTDTQELAIGQFFSITQTLHASPNYLVSINANGTVINPKHVPMGNDGKGYFSIIYLD
ncbi:hypothetical protein [Microscilla marina]|uniref:Lipoprotein, putative n=1 Tax=Microscilla marina ATCC 23134 TaxID=313606 RepID=A1ZMP9_MICM2|nr:hypothetical protein [Microscilla marina]EAY28429.1 lipoprotein, putative [Microscilla marina ATCC 23134]